MSQETPMTWPGCGAGFVRDDSASPVQGAASAPIPDAYSCAKAAQNPNSPTSACAEFCGKQTCFSSRGECVAAQHDQVRADERRTRAENGVVEAWQVAAESDQRQRMAHDEMVTRYAASASDQGAAVKPWQERMGADDVTIYLASSAVPYMKAEIADLRAALAERAQAQPSGTVDELERLARIGRLVISFANKGRWDASEGEGAFEFVQRHSYEVGYSDGKEFTATPAPEQEAVPLGRANGMNSAELVQAFLTLPRHIRDELVTLRADIGGGFVPCVRGHQEAVYCAADVHRVLINLFAAPVEQEAAQVAPPGAQEVHFYRQKGTGQAWIETSAEHIQILQSHPSGGVFEYRTLYTAPVPATTLAEQPEGEANPDNQGK